MSPDRIRGLYVRAIVLHIRAGRPVAALLSFCHKSQRHALDLRPRHCLVAALLLGCLFVGIGRPQYVEDSIDVGGAWVGSLAYNSREDVLYGASEDGVFFAISCDSNKVIGSLPLHDAFAVAYDSIDNKAYCTSPDSLLVVDGVMHARIKSMPMEGATLPVWDEVSSRLYVSCQTVNRVAVLDCATDSLLSYISVGACPMQMYLNDSGRRLYVQNYDAGTVSIIDLRMTASSRLSTSAAIRTPDTTARARASSIPQAFANVLSLVVNQTRSSPAYHCREMQSLLALRAVRTADSST
jgi:hypothetical protein